MVSRLSSLAPRLLAATTIYTLVYVGQFYNEWSLFRFYPLIGELHWQAQPITAGPYIVYYSGVLVALLAGLAAALLLPVSLLPAALLHRAERWAWAVPAAALVLTLFYEARWFRHWFE